ncbi:type I-G CRISPR-associated helicase/endonuclease Cas3g [Actinomyces glycerinitolerans]|uniref:HD Cas3-type domain-containing protein n=1 Tax=Actinomyces glycerinitolerans TaxID=1892869 RepID=A0A1M4S2V2_9ACTO|nr:type I-U CRISPR-associated helicase/endonuclease Cas3 [Actinomyces glycerinitolerans]SHE26552.1 Hypothetical protein ACGLYG10_2803 [Actinomyces glycerinitolerans]
MLEIEDFDDFFELVHGSGVRPFIWQKELLEYLVSHGTWPEQIAAPTGAGKSSVIEVHVFANALAAIGRGARVPRRLAVVVNRRALTDAHAEKAERVKALLDQPGLGNANVLTRVRDALASMRPDAAEDRSPLVVTTMRGAAATDRTWLNAPEACAVLCMTAAMWASSLLFRSYGAPRYARPRLAGMLAVDAAVVVDEAHLNRQIMVTARRVSEFCGHTAEKLGLPVLQAVEMTATPSRRTGQTIGVTRESLDHDEPLARRVQAAKVAEYIPTATWPENGRMTTAYRDDVVDQVVKAVQEAKSLVPDHSDGDHAPRTVGCVLNRVDSAVRVCKALESQGLSCALRVGRMRPWDLRRLQVTEPGLFSPRGSKRIDVLVATQTVEVGVDLDLVSMVTELASGSALAQRAGRVNRLGRREQGRFVVVGPYPETDLDKDVLPYRSADLARGRQWILAREAQGSLSPLAVSENPPEPETPRRLLWQRPEPWDVALWSKTSMDLVVEPELDLWLRDELEPETEEVGVVVRKLSELPDADSCEALVRAVPPQACEVFPALIGTVRNAVEQLLQNQSAANSEHTAELLRHSVLWRDDNAVPDWQVQLAAAMEGERPAAPDLHPGDLLVVDEEARFFTSGVITADGDETCQAVPASDLEGIFRIVTDPEELLEFAVPGQQVLEEADQEQNVEWPPGWEPGSGAAPDWAVFRSSVIVDDESGMRSAFSRNPGWVLLEQHNADVAARARQLATGVDLDAELVEALVEAGRWHDVGKADERFQRFLKRRAGFPDRVAKSRGGSRRTILRAWADAGLPPGWRHELASAAAYWAQDEACTDGERRELVARLIGTSHGRGRPLFNHDPETAGPEHLDALEELVGEGEWESLIARTGGAWGEWAIAYLEAMLRAADCSVSAEGK